MRNNNNNNNNNNSLEGGAHQDDLQVPHPAVELRLLDEEEEEVLGWHYLGLPLGAFPWREHALRWVALLV